jgi:hypothetical protein
MKAADRRRFAAVYRRAAALVDCGKQHYSCLAIDHAAGSATLLADDLIDEFCGLYGCRGCTFDRLFFDLTNYWPDRVEIREIRVLALCLAAAIAEAGDLPEVSE